MFTKFEEKLSLRWVDASGNNILNKQLRAANTFFSPDTTLVVVWRPEAGWLSARPFGAFNP